MSGEYFVLDGHEPRPATLLEWAAWFEGTDNRRVALATWRDGHGEEIAKVSTVFLGFDHSFHGQMHLFETMAFGGPLDEEQRRYSTWDEAMAGHTYLVDVVSAMLGESTTTEEG